MKTASTDLFDLLKSLSKAEKRYIKVNTPSANSHCLKLMDAVLKQILYDENRLKKEYAGEDFLKNLSSNKRYLIELVLRQLDRFRQKEISDRILERVAYAKILAAKNFQKKAEMQLALALKWAREEELFEECLLVLKTIKQNLTIAQLTSKKMKDIQNEVESCLDKIKNIQAFWHLNTRIHLLQIQPRTENGRTNALKALEKEPLMCDISRASTLRSKMYFYQCKAAFHFVAQNPAEAHACNREFLALLDSHPSYLARFPEHYLGTLSNFLIDSLMLGHLKELDAGINTLVQAAENKAFKKIKNLDSRLFKNRFLLELNRALSSSEYDRALSLLPELEKGLKKYKTHIQPQNQIALCYLAAYILFKKQRYDEALNWCNKLLQSPEKTWMPELYQYIRWVNMLSHFELGNHELAAALLQQNKRYFKLRRSLLATEQLLFRFLDKALKTVGKKELTRLARQLKKDLLPYKETDKRFYQYLDLMDWLNTY